MNKKPVKRSPHIIKLSRDHHASLLFCWKLRQGIKLGIGNDRMQGYVSYFAKEHMSPHFHEEETILFPPASDDVLVQRALHEHKVINALVSEIANGDEFRLRHTLEEIADAVDKHVRFEERILFPHLEKKLSEDQLVTISRQLDHEPEKDLYADAFWVKKKE